MTPREIALGIPLGYQGAPVRVRGSRVDPRTALEVVVRDALARPPCGVAFSGGRDSSLVLAVAVHVARRDGLPDPIPLTKVFPDAPETDETEWQEMVIRYLELREWERVVLRDELDLIGTIAREHLLGHGVVWSPMIHGKTPLFAPVRSGSLLDGEGGDEVLGVESHRVAALRALVSSRGRRGRRQALAELAPRSFRYRIGKKAGDGIDLPWLRPGVRREFAAAVLAADLQRPLPYGRSVQMHVTARAWRLAEQSRRAISAPHDVELISPLMADSFVGALARERRLLGLGSRTDAMRHLAGDLLPAPILERTSKASFSGAYWGAETSRFIEHWVGDGVDAELIDAEALKKMWSDGHHHAMTAGLLQQAWLTART